MIPVYQTLTVAKDGHGNCLNACLASLLELRLNEVPTITTNGGGDWDAQWSCWLAEQGYKFDYVDMEDDPPVGYSIATVTTERLYPEGHRKAGKSIYHAIICFQGNKVHDPFPLPADHYKFYYHKILTPLSNAERIIHVGRSQDGFCIHGYRLMCKDCSDSEQDGDEI